MTEGGLESLLALINGESGILGPGIRSYDVDDPRHKPLHEACLELERRGEIVRQIEDGDMVLWMPKKDVAEMTACWPHTDPTPSAHKTIDDYQSQLKAKKKRRR